MTVLRMHANETDKSGATSLDDSMMCLLALLIVSAMGTHWDSKMRELPGWQYQIYGLLRSHSSDAHELFYPHFGHYLIRGYTGSD
jgi:hypothetical protein